MHEKYSKYKKTPPIYNLISTVNKTSEKKSLPYPQCLSEARASTSGISKYSEEGRRRVSSGKEHSSKIPPFRSKSGLRSTCRTRGVAQRRGKSRVSVRSTKRRDLVYARTHTCTRLFVLFKSSHSDLLLPPLLSRPLNALALRLLRRCVCIAITPPPPLHCPGPLSFRGISLDTSGKRTNVWEKKRLDAACIYIYIYISVDEFLSFLRLAWTDVNDSHRSSYG